MRTKMDHWFTVGTCRVDKNGKMIKSIYEECQYTLDSANAKFVDMIESIKNTNKLMHRKHANITVYINEYTVTDRANGEGSVATIRRETV
jgi:hypothetical protein